ncbi:DUF3267 domain-containing protein [Nodosilinea sp. LEGE 07088]|uniref:DUF3267 domain-containing protein n=1 Tax=Nodosilinea sp. LEGE 07088 TaxID=2777968 RepID=UPI00187DDBD8|nr:DUF3267 domain-containing protein [Nodosilinea sp. LEGE 07088]MBE9141327.1 DUF3267 domain-containing protein [Nodosilinea sp. LEGE 07088]
MSTLSQLPPNYRRHSTLNLLRKPVLLLVLILIGIILLLGSGWAILKLTLLIRPEAAAVLLPYTVLDIHSGGGFFITVSLVWVVGAGLAIPITVIIHEAIHGLCFWSVTRRMPRFGWRGVVAYTTTPTELYILRNPYLWITLAPLVILTVSGLVLLWRSPLSALATLICIVAFNASGSVGDIAVALWLLQKPTQTLIVDKGEVITAYVPGSSNLKINDLPKRKNNA